MRENSDANQLKYSPTDPVDMAPMMAIGSLANLGATVLEGDPQAWVRFDSTVNGLNAGVFIASPGTVKYAFPSTEHATILEGEATFTDENGHSETYRAGDSYFIVQGTVMTCACTVRVVKSFLNYTQPC